MNIGVFIDTEKEVGGIYQYSLMFLQALMDSNLKDNFILFSPKSIFKKEKKEIKKLKNWQIIDFAKKGKNQKIKFYKIRRFLGFIYDSFFPLLALKLKPLPLDFNQYKLDLMLYPAAFGYNLFKLRIPYIVCIHDLQHRLNPQFPEVSRKGQNKKTDYLIKNYLKNAKLIIAESETGKKQIQRIYHVPAQKIRVLPYTVVPSLLNMKISKKDIASIEKKYNLKKTYIFYPAQFWPHKNHKLIIKALNILKKRGIIINAVFCGSRQEKYGEFQRIQKLIKKLQLKKQIKYLGFIDDKERAVLYKKALCLVFPTFFGPSNIPPLEAFYFNCPVVASNVEGAKEQLGKAAILFNPFKEKELAESIFKIYKNKKFRLAFIKNGMKIIKKWRFTDFKRELCKILQKAKNLD